MALIGTFPASASAVFNLDFLPEYLLIGSANQATQHLTNLSVVTSGVQLMSITDVGRITALAKFDSGAILDDPSTPGTQNSMTASYLKLATGRINKASTITGTNGTASVQNVFAASTNITNIARRAVEQSINPSANATFSDFEALIFDAGNVLRAQITFDNGFTDEYSVAEIRALYARYHVSDSAGTLEGYTVIDADSGAGRIAQVVLFAGSGAQVVVLRSDYVQL
jgi:hypothetical protein